MSKTQWQPEGGGYYAHIGELHFSMTSINGPVGLSWHNGDGNWVNSGTYPTPSAAALAAEALAASE